jgi:TPR repeat protein
MAKITKKTPLINKKTTTKKSTTKIKKPAVKKQSLTSKLLSKKTVTKKQDQAKDISDKKSSTKSTAIKNPEIKKRRSLKSALGLIKKIGKKKAPKVAKPTTAETTITENKKPKVKKTSTKKSKSTTKKQATKKPPTIKAVTDFVKRIKPRNIKSKVTQLKKLADEISTTPNKAAALNAITAAGESFTNSASSGKVINVSNYQAAAKMYQIAASLGSAQAKFNLALLHEKGQGIKKDPKEARLLYRSAANSGHEQAKTKFLELTN